MKPPKSSYGCLYLVLIGTVLLLGLIVIQALRPKDPGDLALERYHRTVEKERAEDVVAALNKAGAKAEISSGNRITITASASLSDREAREIALAAHQRSGNPVKVVTAAGQVMATAP
ncbi:MAG: hypothetical protein QM680_13420 [Luteolibacter sp.]